MRCLVEGCGYDGVYHFGGRCPKCKGRKVNFTSNGEMMEAEDVKELIGDINKEFMKTLDPFNCPEMEVNTPISKSSNKYEREVSSTTIDVYDVLSAFSVTNPATAHAIKKLLAPGQRGVKSEKQDLTEAMESIKRAIELISC